MRWLFIYLLILIILIIIIKSMIPLPETRLQDYQLGRNHVLTQCYQPHKTMRVIVQRCSITLCACCTWQAAWAKPTAISLLSCLHIHRGSHYTQIVSYSSQHSFSAPCSHEQMNASACNSIFVTYKLTNVTVIITSRQSCIFLIYEHRKLLEKELLT
jgi:hypothetical protein